MLFYEYLKRNPLLNVAEKGAERTSWSITVQCSTVRACQLATSILRGDKTGSHRQHLMKLEIVYFHFLPTIANLRIGAENAAELAGRIIALLGHHPVRARRAWEAAERPC